MGKCRPLTNQMPILNATHDMAQLGHSNLNSCQQMEQSTSYITLTNFKENSRTSAGYSPLEGTNKKHRGKASNLGGTPGPGQSRSLRCTVHQPGHSQREPVFAEELARIHWLRPHCSEQHALWHLWKNPSESVIFLVPKVAPLMWKIWEDEILIKENSRINHEIWVHYIRTRPTVGW